MRARKVKGGAACRLKNGDIDLYMKVDRAWIGTIARYTSFPPDPNIKFSLHVAASNVVSVFSIDRQTWPSMVRDPDDPDSEFRPNTKTSPIRLEKLVKAGVEIDLESVPADEEEPEVWDVEQPLFDICEPHQVPSEKESEKNENLAPHDRPITFSSDEESVICISDGETESDSSSILEIIPVAKRMKLDPAINHDKTQSPSDSSTGEAESPPEAGHSVGKEGTPNGSPRTMPASPLAFTGSVLPAAKVGPLECSHTNEADTTLPPSDQARDLQPINNAIEKHNHPPSAPTIQSPPLRAASFTTSNARGSTPTKVDGTTASQPSKAETEETKTMPTAINPVHTIPPGLTEKQKGKQPQHQSTLSRPIPNPVIAESFSTAAVETLHSDIDELAVIPVSGQSTGALPEAIAHEMGHGPGIGPKPLAQQASSSKTASSSTETRTEPMPSSNVVRHVYLPGCGRLGNGQPVDIANGTHEPVSDIFELYSGRCQQLAQGDACDKCRRCGIECLVLTAPEAVRAHCIPCIVSPRPCSLNSHKRDQVTYVEVEIDKDGYPGYGNLYARNKPKRSAPVERSIDTEPPTSITVQPNPPWKEIPGSSIPSIYPSATFPAKGPNPRLATSSPTLPLIPSTIPAVAVSSGVPNQQLSKQRTDDIEANPSLKRSRMSVQPTAAVPRPAATAPTSSKSDPSNPSATTVSNKRNGHVPTSSTPLPSDKARASATASRQSRSTPTTKDSEGPPTVPLITKPNSTTSEQAVTGSTPVQISRERELKEKMEARKAAKHDKSSRSSVNTPHPVGLSIRGAASSSKLSVTPSLLTASTSMSSSKTVPSPASARAADFTPNITPTLPRVISPSAESSLPSESDSLSANPIPKPTASPQRVRPPKEVVIPDPSLPTPHPSLPPKPGPESRQLTVKGIDCYRRRIDINATTTGVQVCLLLTRRHRAAFGPPERIGLLIDGEPWPPEMTAEDARVWSRLEVDDYPKPFVHQCLSQVQEDRDSYEKLHPK